MDFIVKWPMLIQKSMLRLPFLNLCVLLQEYNQFNCLNVAMEVTCQDLTIKE